MSWKLQEALQRAESDFHTLLWAAGASRGYAENLLVGPAAYLGGTIRLEKTSSILSPTIVSLLGAGAVKRFFRIVQDVSEFGPMSNTIYRMKDQPSLFYLFAMTALSDLYDKLSPAAQANSQQVEVKQAWVDWRAAAEAIVLSYKNFNFMEGPLEDRPELEQMAYRFFVLASINALSPLFDGHFRGIEVKLSKESWKELIRIILRVRAFLVSGPAIVICADVSQSIFQCSKFLAACFDAHARTTRLGMPLHRIPRTPIDALEMMGFSYESLLESLMSLCPQILCQSPAIQLENRLVQYEAVMVMARDYKTQLFVEAFATLGCLARSAHLFKDLRASPEYPIKKDAGNPTVESDCYDRFIMMWRDVLQGWSLDKGDIVSIAEVIRSKILFLVEWWSYHYHGGQLDCVKDITSSLLSILVSSGDASTLDKYAQQTRTISQRMSSRPDVRLKLAKQWKKAYSDLQQHKKLAPPVTEKSDVCALISCESVEPAELRCARCGNALYCSKTCQRSDWKAHRSHCASKQRA